MELTGEQIESLSTFYRGKGGIQGIAARQKFDSVEAVVANHFSSYSTQDHINRKSLAMALEYLGEKPSVIIETGSAAWGTNSTLLFDSYVNSFGGEFASVDIRLGPMWSTWSKVTNSTAMYCDDSISFLKKRGCQDRRIDLLYLDSFDLDWSDPLPAAIHGLAEFMFSLPLLQKYGGLLLVDDTPIAPRNFHPLGSELWFRSLKQYNIPPGKGSLINFYIKENRLAELIMHDYQVLWKFRKRYEP